MSTIAKNAFIKDIKDTYIKEDVCMAELLSFIKPSMTMTLEDCFLAYCELMNWSDKDAFLRVNEDDDFCEDITAEKKYKYNEIFK